MTKLLGKLVLLAAGVVHLGMVAAGRSASLRGCDILMVLRAEALGGAAGVLVALMLLWLSGRRRRPFCRYFADLAPVLLGVVWLVLVTGELAKVDVTAFWPVAAVSWFAIAALAAGMTLASVFMPPRVETRPSNVARRRGVSSAPRPPASRPSQR